ncbi:hypothetical protein ACFV1F_05870 [Streptomyces sp. NPDC059590]|uniref:hypothetical protein n=1 Tax=unclassified Streptomyces TaxID=2593676 RepID=UPI003673BCEF
MPEPSEDLLRPRPCTAWAAPSWPPTTSGGARDTWRQALTMFDTLGHPDAGRVREELGRLG